MRYELTHKKLPTTNVRSRDPVGIQTQDLQNFFWPHSANKKLPTKTNKKTPHNEREES